MVSTTVLIALLQCVIIDLQPLAATPNSTQILIGMLMEYDEDFALEVALRNAISTVNSVPSYFLANIRLGSQIIKTEPSNSYRAIKKGMHADATAR